MKMKQKVISALLGSFLALGVAHAEPFYMDVSGAGGAGFFFPDADTRTGTFNSVQVFANTTTVQNDTDGSGTLNAGDTFSDDGNANITSGLPVGDMEGINLDNGAGGTVGEITISWTNLTGTTTSVNNNPDGTTTTVTDYDSGTVFSFFFEEPGDADYGTSVGSADDTGFTDGTLVLQITISDGTGANTFDTATGEFLTGSSNLNGTITFALEDFWFFAAGDADWNDLLGLGIVLTAQVDQNTNNVETVPGNCSPTPTPGCELFSINSDHDGSIEFARIPEPGTLLLLGIALLGLGTLRRRYA
jgi:hypothetical protein